MAKVPLRKYNSEIESLIDHGQTDEAIAHCRHILKTFPKYIETYRLLGKAYLESNRHSDASDIFNRVLMSVPDDFVSHVGLSIIADEQKQLPTAIWHMERAFEKQPSNAAIQGELQRLYGRRDGRQPPKIRLNRGALAHMYYQGELYTQAGGEIRSVLAEDPSRTDLKTLLALSYFRAGQKVEASEICTQLIGQFPYNLDANRALVEILPGTGKADDISIYHQRVVELDPYAAHTSGSIFLSAEVPDEVVTLDKLEYQGKPVEPGPEWGESLGVSAVTPPAPAVPETAGELKQETPSIPVSAFPQDLKLETATQAGRSAEGSEPPTTDIPEWMRKAGWEESTGEFDESTASVSDGIPGETPAEDIEKADLPEWIKSLAPRDAAVEKTKSIESTSQEPSNVDAETEEWFNKLSGEKPFESSVESPAGQEEMFESLPGDEKIEAVPAWLASLESPVRDSMAPASEADTPAWLTDIGDTDVSPAVGADSTTEWLSKLDQEDIKVTEIHQEGTPAPGPASAAVPVQPPADGGIGNLGTSAAEQDAALLWLESLAAKHGAKSEELISKPEDRLEKPPEWVEQAVEQVREIPAAEPVNLEPAPMETQAEMPEADRTGIWLEEGGVEEEKVEKPLGVDSTAWSGEIEVTPPGKTKPSQPEAMDEVPAWLRSMDGKPVSPAGNTQGGGMPEWLRGEEREISEVPEKTQPDDWMRETDAGTPPVSKPIKVEPAQPAPRKPSAPSHPKPVAKAEPKPQAMPAPKPEPVLKEEQTRERRSVMSPVTIDPTLAAAREAMSRGKIPDAVQTYDDLIRKGRLLEDITFDLKEALYRFPVEVSIWQALGDVYMRSNRLQDALDAYTKAEELLR